MDKSKPEKKPILAWMQPGASRNQQILTVVLVPLQRGIPISLRAQIMMQMDCKIHHLLKEAIEEEPAAKDDFLNRMDSMGFLPYEVDRQMTPWQIVTKMMHTEMAAYLRPEVDRSLTELMEVPGARELYENLTLYEWLDALEEEVSGR